MQSPQRLPNWAKIAISIAIALVIIVSRIATRQIHAFGDANVLVEGLVDAAVGIGGALVLLWTWGRFPRSGDT